MNNTTIKRMALSGLLVFILGLVVTPGVAPAAQENWKSWPPRNYLIQSLVDSVPETLKAFHPETGRFGTEPWVCGDQNVVLPLAAAWSLKSPDNPYYHDKKLLEVIAKAGNALVDDQDENGMWIFKKKDLSTWGQILMPWTYSRWIRAYVLVKDALPPADRQKWEKGLLLGFKGIRLIMDSPRIQNIPCHHAMALYIAGQVFKNKEWRDAATAYQHRVIRDQFPEGYWTENFGPVVSYNMVYVEALGVYYHFSKDPMVPETLRRSAKFHSAVLWSDGTSASTIDERVIYHHNISTGNVGFTFSPEGRGFLLAQIKRFSEMSGESSPNASPRTYSARIPYPASRRGTIGGDAATTLLLYGGSGKIIPLPAEKDKGVTILGKNDALLRRNKPWEWAFSAYTTKPIQNRWIQDRHNLIEIFHRDLGVVIGGGNTKLQPFWSTFTVGDPFLLHHRPSDEDPNFIPAVDLIWAPEKATLADTEQVTRMTLKYGAFETAVSVEPLADGTLAVTFEAPAGKNIEAHLPLLMLADTLKTANGYTFAVSEKDLVLDSKNIGDSFVFGKLKVTVPEGALVRWPCRQHDPYTKDGHSELRAAKLVLALPFDKVTTYRVVISAVQ